MTLRERELFIMCKQTAKYVYCTLLSVRRLGIFRNFPHAMSLLKPNYGGPPHSLINGENWET